MRLGRPQPRKPGAASSAAVLPLAVLAILSLAQPAAAQPAPSDALLSARDELAGKFALDLEELAAWCDERGLTAEATLTRSRSAPRDARKLYLVDPPALPGPSALPVDAGEDAARWQERFHRLRQGYAEKLFDVARDAVRAKRTSLAVELLLAAGLEDPDHEAVRRLFGQELHRGEWRSDFEVRQQKRDIVWHDAYGWLPQDHVQRYENGERFSAGRWMSVEQDARLHADITNGWKVSTEHFTVTTNGGLEAGVRLAARLEGLHRAWRQAFARYFASEAEVSRFILGRGALGPPAGGRHEVVYFKNREEYQKQLRGSVPADFVTQGIYLPDQRTAYFYAADGGDEPGDEGTLYHEATHQLFSECRAARRRADAAIGEQANVWIIEGIACYMESLRREDGCFTVGGADAVRFRDARFRLLEDGFYLPLVELAALGKRQLQRHEQIGMLYSQASGVTHFLMHYEQGRYRDALMGYLEAVYDGRDAADTLSLLTGQSYPLLDRQYREFLEANAE